MSAAFAWRRQLAEKIVSLSALLLPANRLSWAVVMRNEVAHIQDDHEALSWALGLIRASLVERLRELPRQRLFSARSAGVIWIVIFIVSSAFNLSIALAARLGYERIASSLGYWLRGFEYNRFQSFAQAMPLGLFLLMSLVVLAFAISLYLNLRHRPAAFTAFCCAMSLSLVAWLFQLGIPAYLQATSAPRRWRVGICFVLTAGILTALRRNTSAHDPSNGRERRVP